MGVDIYATYLGDLACEVKHGPSGATIRTTPPVDNGGDGSKFSPTDLTAASLATCVLTIFAMSAKAHGVDIAGATAHVEKVMQASPRRIARLPVTLRIPASAKADEGMRKRLESAAKACPIQVTIGDVVDAPTTFIWEGAE